MPMRAAHRVDRAHTKAIALWPLSAYLQELEDCSLGDKDVERSALCFHCHCHLKASLAVYAAEGVCCPSSIAASGAACNLWSAGCTGGRR